MDVVATLSAVDRRDLFSETAQRRGVSPVIIEKDFWVCWMLKQVTSLEPLGPNLIFNSSDRAWRGDE